MQYPLLYNKGCPMVNFKPYGYEFPYGNQKDGKVKRKGAPSGIEQVTLYLPGSFKETAGADWAPQNIIGGTGTGIADNIANEAANAAKTAFGTKVASTVSAEKGFIAMPMDLLVYGGPNPVDLSFSFQMIAISKNENLSIDKIVRNFKKANAPKLGVGLLTYPAIWDIDFVGVDSLGYGDSKGYSWMALSSINVSYSGETNMQVYGDKLATQVNLDLSFKRIKKFMD